MRKGRAIRVATLAFGLMVGGAPSIFAQGIPGLDTEGIEAASGLKGQFISEENVFKIGKPRSDVKIQVDQWAMAPFMGLGSWAAFTPGHGGAMMMGDTVLFEDEVNDPCGSWRMNNNSERTAQQPGSGQASAGK